MTSTTPTHDSPLEDCKRKRHYPSKRSAKLAVKRFAGDHNIYECPHINADGTTHWHVSRRRQAPDYVKRARLSAPDSALPHALRTTLYRVLFCTTRARPSPLLWRARAPPPPMCAPPRSRVRS